MKRMIALLLCLCFCLAACGGKPETEQQPGNKPAQSETGNNAETPQKPENGAAMKNVETLAAAVLPSVPGAAEAAALMEQLSSLDPEKLGDKYWDEYVKLESAYFEQSRKAAEARRELRGDGVTAAPADAFSTYTQTLARAILTGSAEKNAVFSPANIYLALCMLAETVDGESRSQILTLLGLEDVEQARATAKSLYLTLWNESGTGKTALANSVWMNESMDYHKETVDTLAEEYFASSFRAPMWQKSTDAAVAEWINDNTGHLLEEAANGLETKEDTLMLLISTLYFKSQWADQFQAFGTREDVFTNARGAEERIDFMHRSEDHGRYADLGTALMAELPFKDGMTMRFLLPDEDVSMESVLTDEAAFGAFLRGDMDDETAKILWSVPKFDVDCDLDLIPALQQAGIEDVFDKDRADFSPLTDMPAFVSGVQHAARVLVDEEGCEAAAFTVIMAGATAMPMEPPRTIEMDLDRPFAFLITGADGLPLFLAAVNTVA